MAEVRPDLVGDGVELSFPNKNPNAVFVSMRAASSKGP